MIGHTFLINFISISSNENVCITGSNDCCLKVWNIITGNILETKMENEEINCVIFSQSGKLCAASSKECIKVWKFC